MRCTFFIDESGPFEENKSSLVGGYLCFDKDLKQWDKEVRAQLQKLSQNFGITESDLRHRTALKQWHSKNVLDRLLPSFSRYPKGRKQCYDIT